MDNVLKSGGLTRQELELLYATRKKHRKKYLIGALIACTLPWVAFLLAWAGNKNALDSKIIIVAISVLTVFIAAIMYIIAKFTERSISADIRERSKSVSTMHIVSKETINISANKQTHYMYIVELKAENDKKETVIEVWPELYKEMEVGDRTDIHHGRCSGILFGLDLIKTDAYHQNIRKIK